MNPIKKFLHENKVDKNNKTVAIDFDGVIHDYSRGFHDGTIYDGPSDNCEKYLKQLQDRGYNLVCFSARVNADPSGNGKQEIVDWLKKYNLMKYFSDVTDQKVPAIVYIDDSAVRHKDWETTFLILGKLGII
jgi:hypothetical protein